uniref:Uncharacterized protein n=1 Tax=Populus alba TaxID=43335 RepID=A0A4U5P3M1_POPAL|nr:hypothetical protein D5086_0000234450 [Populus alba]
MADLGVYGVGVETNRGEELLDNHYCWIEKNLGQSAEAKVSAGGSRWFNGEKEVTVQMKRSTVVLRSARLELLEMEEAAGDEDLPLLLTVQKSLLLINVKWRNYGRTAVATLDGISNCWPC